MKRSGELHAVQFGSFKASQPLTFLVAVIGWKVSTVMVELDRLELGAFTPRISYDKRWVLELAMDMERNAY